MKMQWIVPFTTLLILVIFTLMLSDTAKIPTGTSRHRHGWKLIWYACVYTFMAVGISLISPMDSMILWKEALAGKIVSQVFLASALVWSYLIAGLTIIGMYYVFARSS